MAKLMQPHSFLRNAEGALVNYSYTDVADGTGVIVFYGATAHTSAGATQMLTTQQVYSKYIVLDAGTYNFDLTPFNSPRVMKGTAYLNVGHWTQSAGSNSIVKVKIQKSSGGSVTDCSSQISSDTLDGNGAHIVHHIPIALTTTNFKKGDFLRCEIVVNSDLNPIEIGVDPVGRDGTNLNAALTNPACTTKFKLYIPFRIDI